MKVRLHTKYNTIDNVKSFFYDQLGNMVVELENGEKQTYNKDVWELLDIID